MSNEDFEQYEDVYEDVLEPEHEQSSILEPDPHSVDAAPPIYQSDDSDYDDDELEIDYEYGDYETRIDDQLPEIEGRSSWLYLGVLLISFFGLIGAGWACDSPADETVSKLPGETANAARVQIDLNGDIVTLGGVLPDEQRRDGVLEAVQGSYGEQNIVNNITINPTAEFNDATFAIAGKALNDDTRPDELRSKVESLGFEGTGFSVDRSDTLTNSVDIELKLEGNSVTVFGVVPDEQSLVAVRAAASAISDSPDSTSVEARNVVWPDGVIRVTGDAEPTDSRIQAFITALEAELADQVEEAVPTPSIDLSALSNAPAPSPGSDTNVSDRQAEIKALQAADPITFEPLSADVSSSSDTVIASIVKILSDNPSLKASIVGHTDSAGDADKNRVLSRERADAVRQKLIDENIAADRLTASGVGSDVPVASNDTPEGRAQNRRIEFELS